MLMLNRYNVAHDTAPACVCFRRVFPDRTTGCVATLERGREGALFDAGVLSTHRPHWSRQLTEGRRGEFSRRAVDIAPCSAIVLRI